jgi:serine/threonine protein kinase
MVTEFLEGGSLFDVMHKRKKKLDVAQVIRIAKQVAVGMNYLHLRQPQIIHRDLKSLNLLVDDAWRVKLCGMPASLEADFRWFMHSLHQ